MIQPNDRFERSADVLYRRIKGEGILLPVHPGGETSRKFYCLEGVGDRIWELLDGRRKYYAVVQQIAKEFGVDKEQIAKEVLAFLNDLSREGLIRRLS